MPGALETRHRAFFIFKLGRRWKWVPRGSLHKSARIIFRLQLYCVRPFGLGGRAGGEEDYEFEFAELGFEVGGDFGDAFEGLESLVFDVDYGEADGLQLPQDAR